LKQCSCVYSGCRTSGGRAARAREKGAARTAGERPEREGTGTETEGGAETARTGVGEAHRSAEETSVDYRRQISRFLDYVHVRCNANSFQLPASLMLFFIGVSY